MFWCQSTSLQPYRYSTIYADDCYTGVLWSTHLRSLLSAGWTEEARVRKVEWLTVMAGIAARVASSPTSVFDQDFAEALEHCVAETGNPHVQQGQTPGRRDAVQKKKRFSRKDLGVSLVIIPRLSG